MLGYCRHCQVTSVVGSSHAGCKAILLELGIGSLACGCHLVLGAWGACMREKRAQQQRCRDCVSEQLQS
jgi:hypothetical protein